MTTATTTIIITKTKVIIVIIVVIIIIIKIIIWMKSLCLLPLSSSFFSLQHAVDHFIAIK